MASDDSDLSNPNAEDAAKRLCTALLDTEQALIYGLTENDIVHLTRILRRAMGAAADSRTIRDSIVDEDATYVCARADEVVSALNGIFLTAERLAKRAEDIREAAADFKNAIERTGDDGY